MTFTDADKQRVLNWLEKYCFGFREARFKNNILPFLNINERVFRAIVSDLKHEGNVAATSQRGYWFIPLTTDDPAEVDAALESFREMESRALDMLTGIKKQMYGLNQRKMALTQQYELPLPIGG